MRTIPSWNRSVLLLLLAVAAYFQTWSDLWPYWEHKDATYTHGTLIALIAMWLVWNARPAFVGIVPAANPAILPAVLLLSAVWLAAARANLFIVHAMLWPLLAFAIVWAGAGWRAARHLAFPLGFLYFAIPFWEYFKPALQAISAFMVGLLTSLIGIPGHVDGPYVVLPDTTIFIALDCSGAHFLSVALAVGALAVKFRRDPPRTAILVIGMAAAFSLVFNWLRILLIVLAYLNPTLKHWLETMGHLTFGWWVFALDLVVFCLVLQLVPSSGRPATRQPEQPPEAPAGNPRKTGWAIAAAAALLLPVSSWTAQIGREYPADLASPPALPGMAGPTAPNLRWQPRFPGAAWAHRAAYIAPGGRIVELYRNEYHRQSQGKELIANGTPLFDPRSFATEAATTVSLKKTDAAPLEATRSVLRDRSGRKWVALHTYIVDGHVVASPSKAQFLTALQSFYDRPAAGVLAVMMPCLPDCSSANRDLDAAMIVAQEAYQRADR